MPKRVLNWDVKLTDWAMHQLGKDFKWGSTDCCSLLRGALWTMYDEDIFERYRWWKSKRGAMRAAKEYGIRIVLNSFPTSCHKLSHSQQGDVLVMDSDDFTPIVGVCVAGGILGSEPDGIVNITKGIDVKLLPAYDLYRFPNEWIEA